MPEVSIVIPTHNRASFIEDAVESALRQTFRDREILVIDDGSTDDTSDRLRRFGRRIRVIRKEQGGSASARNLGIEESRGTWIAFLDSDDLWIDMKTEVQVSFLRGRPEFAWLASSYWKLEGGREFLRTREGRSGHVFRDVWEKNFVRTSTVMVRRDCFDDVGRFDPDLPINQDLDLWLRLAKAFPLGYIPSPLAIYRHHPGGKSRDVLRSRKIYVDLIGRHDDPDRIPRWAARRRMAYLQASVGKHQLALGEIEAGRQTLGRAVRTWPFSLKTWRLIPKSYFPRPRRSRTDGDGHSSNDRSPLDLTVRTGESERVRRIVDHYQKSLERGGIRILREGHKGRVARLPDPDGEVIVKHYRSGGLADSLRSLISGSRAVRAWNHADALRRKGLGAPPIVGVADRDWRGMPFDSLLIMAPIADAVEMDRALCRVAEGPARQEELRSMLSLFARTLRDMHEAGLVHADLKSCNVLVHGARSAWGFTFLDLEDISLRSQVPLKLRLENLAQLNATVPSWIGTSDRLRFFLSVLGKSRLDTEGKDLFRGVLERSRQKDRVWYDQEGVVRESWSPV